MFVDNPAGVKSLWQFSENRLLPPELGDLEDRAQEVAMAWRQSRFLQINLKSQILPFGARYHFVD